MSKYKQVALDALSACTTPSQQKPREAWQIAADKHFGKGTEGAKKGCPRTAFLGLCSEGYIKDIPSGKYIGNFPNKRHAIDAVAILRQEPSLASDPTALWERVLHGEEKTYNYQMHVVIALWENGYIVPEY